MGKPHSRMTRAEYKRLVRPLHIELLKLQRLIEEQGLRMLVLFEGRDAAGKGGAIKRITKHLNPRGCRVVALRKPNEQELGQWYFQRYLAHLPSAGEMVLFDRSWYNRAGLERVMGFCTEDQAEYFLQNVPELEGTLVRDGITLLKLYFDVDRAEQKRRLEARHHNPLKKWKLTWLDQQAQDRWDDYTDAEAEMFRRTSTAAAPWERVDANDKRRARVEVMRRLLAAFDYPKKRHKLARVDARVIQRLAGRGILETSR